MALYELTRALRDQQYAFASVVGNPPYQDSSQTQRVQSPPIFHLFNLWASRVSPKVSLIYPSKWLYWDRGESGAFTEAQYASNAYRYFRDFSSSLSLFDGVEVAGGICFFLIDGAWSGLTSYSYDGQEDVPRSRILGPGRVRDPRASEIVDKVYDSALPSMSSLVGAYGHYLGAEVTVAAIERAYDPSGSAQVYYLKDGGVGLISVRDNFLRREPEAYKVFVSKTANPKGLSLRRADRIFVGQPGQAGAVSFLRIGPFETESEARNCEAYMKSDLCNFLVGVRALTHNTTKRSYNLIPLVDFSSGQIIGRPKFALDFSSDLNPQLALLFNLSEADQAYMRLRIKPWPLSTSIEAKMFRESSPS